MKNTLKSILIAFILISPTSLFSQGRTHQRFYLSIQPGPALGYINGNNNQQTSLKVEGTGIGLDFQIGGAIKENLILYGVLGLKSIYGPTITIGGQSNTKATVSDQYSFDEFIFGVGSTYYLKNNFFFSGNIGMGNFSFSDEASNTTVDTGNGFSFQVKAGHEWWISPRWALGVALEYGGTRATDKMDNYEETWQSHRYSIRLTATLNGYKN
jgi:hypothetical protein